MDLGYNLFLSPNDNLIGCGPRLIKRGLLIRISPPPFLVWACQKKKKKEKKKGYNLFPFFSFF
jgi:hypothetical protein